MTFFVWMASTSESYLCRIEEKNWRMWWKHCQVISNLVFPPWFSKRVGPLCRTFTLNPGTVGWRGLCSNARTRITKAVGSREIGINGRLILYMPTWWWWRPTWPGQAFRVVQRLFSCGLVGQPRTRGRGQSLFRPKRQGAEGSGPFCAG